MPHAERPAGTTVSRRSAALTASLVALPLTLAVLLGMVWVSGGFTDRAVPTAAPTVLASGPVAVSLPGSIDQRTQTTCRALLASLPPTLGGHAGRPVTPTAAVERAAAWGAPTIVLRCGVGAPYLARGTTEVITINGVDWVETKSGLVSVFRVSGRSVAIELDVPARYATGAGGALMLRLAAPISSTVPTAG